MKKTRKPAKIENAVNEALKTATAALWSDIHKEIVQTLSFRVDASQKKGLALSIYDPDYGESRTINLSEKIKESAADFVDHECFDDLEETLAELLAWVKREAKKQP